jgi:hypothetical protein
MYTVEGYEWMCLAQMMTAAVATAAVAAEPKERSVVHNNIYGGEKSGEIIL